MESLKVQRRNGVRKRIRKHIKGDASCPRLSVFRSNKQIYAQIIDDTAGHTLVSASSRDLSADAKMKKADQALEVGKLLGAKAVSAGLSKVVFDRGGYLYHGRVKSLAEGARSAGLKF